MRREGYRRVVRRLSPVPADQHNVNANSGICLACAQRAREKSLGFLAHRGVRHVPKAARFSGAVVVKRVHFVD